MLCKYFSWQSVACLFVLLTMSFFFFFLKRFIVDRGEGLSCSWLPLSSWWPGHCSAPHSFSWQERVSPPCSWWSWGPTCPWKSWIAPWAATHQGWSCTRPAQTWCVWWSGGSCVSVCSHSCSWSPVALVEAYGHGTAPNHGWCSSVAAMEEATFSFFIFAWQNLNSEWGVLILLDNIKIRSQYWTKQTRFRHQLCWLSKGVGYAVICS